MGDVELTERDLATRRVMKTLARLRAHRDVFPVRDARGVAPIIITLPNDRVGDVEDRVRGAGGLANVALAYSESFTLWSWDMSSDESAPTVDVHEDSTMDMLRVWVSHCEGHATNLNLIRSELSHRQELAYQV